jgi:hypothetical protein
MFMSMTLTYSHNVMFKYEQLCSSQLVGFIAYNDRLVVKDELKIIWKATY